MFFPLVAGACADSAVALGRIGQFLLAEEHAEPYTILPEAEFAIDAEGDFTWETVHAGKVSAEVQPDITENKDKNGEPPPPTEDKAVADVRSTVAEEKCEDEPETQKDVRGWFGRKSRGKPQPEPALPTNVQKEGETARGENVEKTEKPFELKDIDFKVGKGSFVVFLGPVGCGKVGPCLAHPCCACG